LKSSLYGAGAEYALHSLLVMVSRTEPVSVRDLARFQNLPERFLAKLFTRLKKAGVVHGIEGIRGGFALARPPERISVMDVLAAVDPDRSLFECAEIRRNCKLFGSTPPKWSVAGPCSIHLVMREAEHALQSLLMSKSLADLENEFARKAPNQFIQDAESWFVNRRGERTNGHRGESPHDRSQRHLGASSRPRQPQPENREKPHV
jgi:Rrf2 family protein